MTSEQRAHAAMLAWSAPILGAGIAGYLAATVIVPLLIGAVIWTWRRIRHHRP